MDPYGAMSGYELRASSLLTKTIFRVHPRYQDPWVEYGPEDYGWLAGLGMGEYVSVPDEKVCVVRLPGMARPVVVAHPAVIEKIKLHGRT